MTSDGVSSPDVIPPVTDLLDLTGHTAVVTGAGSGIGLSIARRLAEAGAAVGVHYHRSAEGAAEVVSRIEAAGGRAAALQADIADPDDVRSLFDRCAAQLGDPTIVVNNAGIYPVSPLLEMDPGEWDAVLAANLRGVHLATQEAARRMVAAGVRGAIVNVASIEGMGPMPAHAHYAASKAGVLMHTRAAALELGPHGIRVNAVSPGLIGREGIEGAWPEGVARWLEACPLGRLGDAFDVADACLFLASRAARWITGANLVVDGGALSRPLF